MRYENEQAIQPEGEPAGQGEEFLATADRQEAEGRVRGQALALAVVAAGVTAWTLFAPQPYALCVTVAALLPWVAVMLTTRSAGLIRILPPKGDRHPNVTLPFILPSAAMGLRALHDYRVLDWQRMVVVVAVAGGMLMAAAVVADVSLRGRPGTLLGLAVLCGLWGYGTGMAVDALPDHSTATVYRAAVREKYVSHGRSANYHLRLGAWGPREQADDVAVTRRFYETVEAGDTVCLPLKSGALGVRWYVVEACR